MTLKQKRPGSGTTEIQLLDDKLIVRYSKGSNRTESSINYTSLLVDPDYRASADKRLVVAAGFAALMASFLMFSSRGGQDTELSPVMVMAGLILLGLSALLVRKYFTSKFDLCLFYYGNGSPAFNLNRNQPDQETYEKFVADVSRRVKTSIDEISPPGLPGSIALELEKLGRLKDRNLLTEEEFAKAKEGLLSQIDKGSRTLGFHQS